MSSSIAGVQLDQEGKQLEPTIKPDRNLEGWSVSGRPILSLYVIFMIFFGLLTLAGVLGYRTYPHPPNDFFAFNSFSRFIRQHPPMLIYDQGLLRHFQDLPNHKLFAFMYHPGMMLLLWPLAYLPYDAGYVLWIGVGLAACSIAVAGSRNGWPLALLVLVAPSTLWTSLAGQSSLLVAGLLIGGLLLSPRRPLLAGLLIGLATYKPQLGILVPVALIAAGQWRTMLAAFATTLCIVLLSTLVFGAAVWPAWFHHLSSIVDVRSAHATDWAPVQATVASNLISLGIGGRIAETVQVVTSIVSILCVWNCFRPSGRQDDQSGLRLKVAALGTATFLAAPFAFTYDLPLFTGAVLLFVDERRRAEGTFMFREVLAIVAGMMLPCCVLSNWLHCLSGIVVALMLCTIMHRLRDLRRGHDYTSNPTYLPHPVTAKA